MAGNVDDASLTVGLLRVVQRDVADGFESIRESLARIHEAIERLHLAHDDNAQRIAALEQSATKRRAGMRK